VNSSGIPVATQQALLSHQMPHIYVLGPRSVIPDAILTKLRKYGTVNRVGNADPAANSVAFAVYRDGCGSYGPQLLVDAPDALPQPVLNFFLNYATPGYTAEGPTAAVYNHGWVIGDPSTISVSVQAEMDSLLEVVPQK
jgi:hypothetical protein